MTDDGKHFIVSLTFPGGAPPAEAQHEQKAFLGRLFEDGVLVLAGRFVDERGGGMSIIRAGSLEEASARFGESPLVRGDHVELDVREWAVTWGREVA